MIIDETFPEKLAMIVAAMKTQGISELIVDGIVVKLPPPEPTPAVEGNWYGGGIVTVGTAIPTWTRRITL